MALAGADRAARAGKVADLSTPSNAIEAAGLLGREFEAATLGGIRSTMSKLGAGNRELVVGYPSDPSKPAHMFNVIVNQAGEVKFWDHQVGRASDPSRFDVFDFLITTP